LEARTLDTISDFSNNIINSCESFEKFLYTLVYEVCRVLEIMLELLHAPHTTAKTII
jgi:hypothetical protein